MDRALVHYWTSVSARLASRSREARRRELGGGGERADRATLPIDAQRRGSACASVPGAADDYGGVHLDMPGAARLVHHSSTCAVAVSVQPHRSCGGSLTCREAERLQFCVCCAVCGAIVHLCLCVRHSCPPSHAPEATRFVTCRAVVRFVNVLQVIKFKYNLPQTSFFFMNFPDWVTLSPGMAARSHPCMRTHRCRAARVMHTARPTHRCVCACVLAWR
jgi:hypothetical protein